MKDLLETFVNDCAHYTAQGHVATYIPELANMDPDKIGIYLTTEEGQEYCAGDCFDRFTIQSVVKPLILLLALMDSGMEKVRDLVGVEATGKPFDAFNYSDQALTGAHINPMINTGAIALCTARHTRISLPVFWIWPEHWRKIPVWKWMSLFTSPRKPQAIKTVPWPIC